MPSLLNRAARLDNRLFGRAGTPEEWRRNARRWRWWLVIAFCFLLMSIWRFSQESAQWGAWRAWTVAVPSAAFSLWFAFVAGLWRAEHDRLQGKDRVLGARRPEGL